MALAANAVLIDTERHLVDIYRESFSFQQVISRSIDRLQEELATMRVSQ